jgi:hypothetical protein
MRDIRGGWNHFIYHSAPFSAVRLEMAFGTCHISHADEGPGIRVRGLRARNSFETIFAPPLPFLQLPTTLATRDVLKTPRFRRPQPWDGRFAV